MPLSWNEIRDRATAFSHEWADEAYERGEAQTFRPAGCGNFLVVTYRALRELELDVLRASHRSGQLSLDALFRDVVR